MVIPQIALATEDLLSEEIGVRLATEAGLEIRQKLRRGGNGYLRSRLTKFCDMASHTPVLLITDLDDEPCPGAMIKRWFGSRHRVPNVLARVAVREIESWVLADHRAMGQLFDVRVGTIPREPDSLPDPKSTLIKLASKAPRRVREDLLPEPGAIASQGLGYNARLSEVVRFAWSPERAASRSPSLKRTRRTLRDFADRLRQS